MRKLCVFLIIFSLFVVNLRFFKTKNFVNSYSINDLTCGEAMVTIEKNSKRILYSKNQNKRLPMASTTKIITAIVAIENCDDLDKKQLITKDMTGVEGSSIYLKAGEHLSVRELLYGLMLRSGNDAAVAIAEIISGSVENFVKLMNDFCKNLKLNDTHIVTVNGLHDDEHFTSAKDLAVAACYALENATFSEIVKTKEKVISGELDKVNKCRLLKNKNKLLNNLAGADGVKTGYTIKAGRCFVGSATRFGMQVVCVLLNCRPMFEDAKKLIEKAFDEYKNTNLFKSGIYSSHEDNNSIFELRKDVILPIRSDEISKVYAKLNLDKSQSTENATLDFYIENDLIFSEKIYTIIEEKNADNGFIKNLGKVIRAF